MSIRQCSCGFCTDDDNWFMGHLFENPSHADRTRTFGSLSLPSLPAPRHAG